MRTERSKRGPGQVVLTDYKTQLCLESCGSQSQSAASR